jgi:hypothetical protein
MVSLGPLTFAPHDNGHMLTRRPGGHGDDGIHLVSDCAVCEILIICCFVKAPCVGCEPSVVFSRPPFLQLMCEQDWVAPLCSSDSDGGQGTRSWPDVTVSHVTLAQTLGLSQYLHA